MVNEFRFKSQRMRIYCTQSSSHNTHTHTLSSSLALGHTSSDLHTGGCMCVQRVWVNVCGMLIDSKRNERKAKKSEKKIASTGSSRDIYCLILWLHFATSRQRRATCVSHWKRNILDAGYPFLAVHMSNGVTVYSICGCFTREWGENEFLHEWTISIELHVLWEWLCHFEFDKLNNWHYFHGHVPQHPRCRTECLWRCQQLKESCGAREWKKRNLSPWMCIYAKSYANNGKQLGIEKPTSFSIGLKYALTQSHNPTPRHR